MQRKILRMNDQEALTRAFVAEHIRSAHRAHPTDMAGCMICAAWRWARELRLLDDSAVKEAVEKVPAIIDVAHVHKETT